MKSQVNQPPPGRPILLSQKTQLPLPLLCCENGSSASAASMTYRRIYAAAGLCPSKSCQIIVKMADGVLFHDFYIITIESQTTEPRVKWRMPTSDSNKPRDALQEKELVQFAFPYPELFRRRIKNDISKADEFCFVLTKSGKV